MIIFRRHELNRDEPSLGILSRPENLNWSETKPRVYKYLVGFIKFLSKITRREKNRFK